MQKATEHADADMLKLEQELKEAHARIAELEVLASWGRHYEAGKKSGTIIEVEYPVAPRARDLSSSPHMRQLLKKFESRREWFYDLLLGFEERHGNNLRTIPLDAPEDPRQPYWLNGWMPGLDAAAIYAFIADRKPRTYFEVGSGNSTKFARKAISDYGLSTRIVSVDPHPRAEVDAICDELYRMPFEDFDIARMEAILEAGDVVFIDNSHRVLPNSDVTVFFMEALGRIPLGCLYGVHDIFLPYDYPDEWCKVHYFTEQYVLAAYLFGGAGGDEIVLPCGYVSLTRDLMCALDGLWNAKPGTSGHSGAFWLQKN